MNKLEFRPFKNERELELALEGDGAFSSKRPDLFWEKNSDGKVIDQHGITWESDLLKIGKLEDYGIWVGA